MVIKMDTKRYIWRIWSWNSNDRQEIARVATKGIDEDSEFEIVQQFLVKEFIKPEFRSKVELTERGFEWDDKTPEECLNYGMKPEEGESPCENCDGCLMGYEIDFVGREGSDYGTEPELRLINGTNSFYDLTEPKKPKKSADWNSLLRKAFDKSPQHGIAVLVARETPKQGIDPKYLRKCEEIAKDLESKTE